MALQKLIETEGDSFVETPVDVICASPHTAEVVAAYQAAQAAQAMPQVPQE
jgi:hypothetical protein